MEKEIDLVHKMNRELGEINTKIAGLDEKISENHGVHLENADKLEKILVQTTKTNGKVINCEKFIEEQLKINSKLDGLLLTNWKRIEDESLRVREEINRVYTRKEENKIMERLVYGFTGLLLTGVVVSAITMVLNQIK